MRTRVVIILLALVAGCSAKDAPKSTPSMDPSAGDNNPTVECGAACQSDDECGSGRRCLAAATGGKVCKPASCPDCPSGNFCVYDKASCTASAGCTSFSCGFTFVDGCDTCVTANCCGDWKVCADDANCAKLAICISSCADQACENQCWATIPRGTTALEQAAFETTQTFYRRASNCTLAKCSNEGCPLGPAAAPGVCRTAAIGCGSDKDCCDDTRCTGADINAPDTRLCCLGTAAACNDDDECCSGGCGNHRCGSVPCRGCDRFDECTAFGKCCSPDPDIQCGFDNCGVEHFCQSFQHCVGTHCLSGCSAGSCAAGAACIGGYCTSCSNACNGQTCGTTCAGASCGQCTGDKECVPLNGGFYCGYGPCTPQCAGKACGDNGCHGGSCGTCPVGKACSATGQCVALTGGGSAGGGPGGGTAGGTSSGGGAAGGGCQAQSNCVKVYAGTGVCKDTIGLRSTCAEQVTCHYTLSDGGQGCALPAPGDNDCAISASGATVASLDCVAGDQDCVNGIGCNL